jgi:hypothetical protein
MLHIESLKGNTLDILKGLMQISELKSLNLAGGTGLALKYGHRTSIDLDLFSSGEFENQEIFDGIKKMYSSYRVLKMSNKAGIFGFIDDVKLDIVRHNNFKLIAPVEEIKVSGSCQMMI